MSAIWHRTSKSSSKVIKKSALPAVEQCRYFLSFSSLHSGASPSRDSWTASWQMSLMISTHSWTSTPCLPNNLATSGLWAVARYSALISPQTTRRNRPATMLRRMRPVAPVGEATPEIMQLASRQMRSGVCVPLLQVSDSSLWPHYSWSARPCCFSAQVSRTMPEPPGPLPPTRLPSCDELIQASLCWYFFSILLSRLARPSVLVYMVPVLESSSSSSLVPA